MRKVVRVSGVIAALALAGAGVAGADGTPLKGSVGPGFAISLRDGSGGTVSHLDAGAYSLGVGDQSDNHDFHLIGPGVDVSTTVEEVGDKSFAVTLADGTYTFFCDAHPLQMKGTFTVGAVTAPPAPPPPTEPPPKPKLTRVSLTVTDAAISLRTAAGKLARTLTAGTFSVKVVDRSKNQNAHLVGAGVNRKTGIAFVGTVTWKVTLKAGKLTFKSDAAKPRLRTGSATVSA